jgi:hypothetical protein
MSKFGFLISVLLLLFYVFNKVGRAYGAKEACFCLSLSTNQRFLMYENLHERISSSFSTLLVAEWLYLGSI